MGKSILSAFLSLLLMVTAWADGTETLGAPSIAIASGSGIVAAGTGMVTQPGMIDIGVPAGATVNQVLLYWEGQMSTDVPGDSAIVINGNNVTGTLIGGPTFFFGGAYSSAFRADITALGLVSAGANTLTVDGLSFSKVANGAGILVVFDDGSGLAEIDIRDGLDNAFINFPEPRKSTVPQTITFAPAVVDRVADFDLFFSSVAGTVSGADAERPTSIEVTVKGTTTVFSNELASLDGEEWDTVNIGVDIPAGASSLTVQAFSRDDNGTGKLPASFTWTAAGLSILPPRAALGNCVWQDLNNDGIQAGDGEGCVLGSDSEPPVPNVKVNLLVGPNCEADPDNRMQTTDANGFYLFDNLEPGTYCVEFEKPSDLCEFGDPVFTGQDQDNDDAVDSDANPATGKTGPVTLQAGETNLTVDAGLFCPSIDLEKFTNGHDADAADGFPTPTPPSGGFVVGDNKVPLVAIGSDITWTYRVTNTSTATLNNIAVTDFRLGDSVGVTVSCPMTSLEPGESMDCLAIGTGLDLASTAGTILGCDAEGQGTPEPTYENEGRVTATGPGGVEVSDVDLSHYCNPPDVMVEKFTNGHDGDDAGGIPDSNAGSFNPGGLTVAEVEALADITWTYRVTNTGTEALENVAVFDSKGVFVNCPANTLAPGASFDCTATGLADDLLQSGGDVPGCDGPQGQGDSRPTYANLATVTGNGQTSGIQVTDDDPSHYCNPPPPPPCGLTVQKSCELPPPPLPPAGKCDGKLQAFTMIWDGILPIQITSMSSGAASASSVAVGQEVTFAGPFSNNDVVVNITGGQSTFHVSCSDKDMDGDTATNEDQQQVSPLGRDCGKFEGDGKGSSGINDWLLEGFIDKSNAVLDCTTDPEPGASSCEFRPAEASCDTLGKPSNLTFEYTGGGCPGDNAQGSKSDCSGSIDPSLPIMVTLDGGTLGPVNPGETFIVPTTGSNTTIVLSNNGGTQTNDVHTSCSAPLAAGDSYGSITLVAMDGIGNGTDVIYSYLVGNQGPVAVTGITVDDDQLGRIGTIASLQPGASDTLTAMAFITQTTTNVATVDGVGAPGAECKADSNPVVVTALPPPPCDVSIAFKELKDDAIKWTLSNDSAQRKATMETFTLEFPSDFGAIKEVKLDGAIFKAGDSSTYPNGVLSGQTIGSGDWTNTDVSKRQLDPGESRTLEVKFTDKDQNASQGDFDLTVTFEEGCAVAF